MNSDLIKENLQLRNEINELKNKLKQLESNNNNNNIKNEEKKLNNKKIKFNHNLNANEIYRYGRQLILPDFGVESQDKISKSRVLVIGAGGLGSTICLYLCAAGIGHLGIIDGDYVDLDNLHRQIIHNENSYHINKAISARNTCKKLNSSINIIAYNESFTSNNALNIVKNNYDILVDASDNVATRYLINDVAILCKIPLVSGSALRMEGQITIYGYNNGPCYRCLFPVPPPPSSVTNCNDGGVLGPVPGLVGCIQALEVLKIMGEIKNTEILSQKLLLIDTSVNRYLTVRLRNRNINCDICGDKPKINKLIDYEQFCGSLATDINIDNNNNNNELLDNEFSISCKELSLILENDKNSVLLDVRASVQYKICAIPQSINIPLSNLNEHMNEISNFKGNIYVMCRRGIDSITATSLLRSQIWSTNKIIQNVRGGLLQWKKQVNPDFPLY